MHRLAALLDWLGCQLTVPIVDLYIYGANDIFSKNFLFCICFFGMKNVQCCHVFDVVATS